MFSFQGPIELLFLFSQFDLLIRISVSRDSNQQIIRSAFLEVVGPSGLEPPTSRLSVVRSSQLSYGPILVENSGIEPLTSCLQSTRSPS